MPHRLLIREMRSEDAPAVADLATQLGYPATASEIRHRYDQLKDRSDARLLVAENAAQKLVGWIHTQMTLSLESDRRAEIWGLVVDETARGTGVGRRLVEAGEQWALTAGVSVMVVRSNEKRAAAKGFYEHLGYTVTKTQNAFRKVL